jgi:hypothetical protein
MIANHHVEEPTAERSRMFAHLDQTYVLLDAFGCVVALSEDRSTIFTCAVNADSSPERESDHSPNFSWVEVTAPEPEFLEMVNRVFRTSFRYEDFAGR